jgi:CRP-like cAMP-binding protein
VYENVRKYFSQFANLSEEEWLAFQSILKVEKVKKKTRIIEYGLTCHKMYYVNKGSLRLFYYKDGEEVCGKFFFEDELASSFESYIKQIPGMQILETMENCELVSFSYDDQQAIYTQYPVFYKLFLNMLQNSFGQVQKLITIYILTDPLERYVSLTKLYPQIIARVPQKYIASFLGITHFSLSRIRKRLKEK